jgi:RHS repeat-associated protein
MTDAHHYDATSQPLAALRFLNPFLRRSSLHVLLGMQCRAANSKGKERDFESGLDNFGARYNASSMGRFMSPDPENAGAALGSPQSWNAYSYVLNNPLNAIDPDGLDCVYVSGASDNPESHADGSPTIIHGDCKSDNDSGVFVNNDTSHPVQNSDVTVSNDGSVGVVSYTRTDGLTTGYACIGNCPSDSVRVTAGTPTIGPMPITLPPTTLSPPPPFVPAPAFDLWHMTPQQKADV